MSTFVHIWALLEPKLEYTNLMNKCKSLWDSFSLEEQRIIYRTIRKKKSEKIFVDYNPLLAIRHNIPKKPTYRILSFNDYYTRFGTTEEQGGWKKIYQPEQQKTIYIKQ